MKKDEILELSKKKPNDNCCIFCESKCAKCGSVNIEVEYRIFYKFDDKKMVFDHSFTEVCCHACPDSVKKRKIDLPGSLRSVEIMNLTFIEKSSLGKQIDLFFEDEKPKKISSELKARIQKEGIEYFMRMYTYRNNTRDHIKIESYESHCLDKYGSSKNSDEIKSLLGSMLSTANMSFDCKADPDNPESHFVIEATTMKIVS
jgi:hypothetical protein